MDKNGMFLKQHVANAKLSQDDFGINKREKNMGEPKENIIIVIYGKAVHYGLNNIKHDWIY